MSQPPRSAPLPCQWQSLLTPPSAIYLQWSCGVSRLPELQHLHRDLSAMYTSPLPTVLTQAQVLGPVPHCLLIYKQTPVLELVALGSGATDLPDLTWESVNPRMRAKIARKGDMRAQRLQSPRGEIVRSKHSEPRLYSLAQSMFKQNVTMKKYRTLKVAAARTGSVPLPLNANVQHAQMPKVEDTYRAPTLTYVGKEEPHGKHDHEDGEVPNDESAIHLWKSAVRHLRDMVPTFDGVTKESQATAIPCIAITHLVLSFAFAPSKKETVWRNGGVVSPSVKDATSLKPELPVVMTAL
ncbi:hypothetical protein C8T65DRAFT_724867 [Cerioporus squamosus]|nr:hypothetical protein C8T65DRAFT_724867 [Cerioporus squamosus]